MEKINWTDFEKVEMRAGTIVSVEDFPEAKNAAYILHIDFGSEMGMRKSSAQITGIYNKEELLGKQIIAVVNFPAKQIGPIQSECLVLGAVGENKEVILLQPERLIPNGLRIG